MNIIWKLTFGTGSGIIRPRMILTSLAIVAAACVVIWVVSGYDALVGQFGGFASDYLGRYDLIVLPEVKGVSAVPQLSPELVEALGRDTEVAEINPVMQTRARITNPNLPPEEQTPFGPGNIAESSGRQRTGRKCGKRNRASGRRRQVGRRYASGHDVRQNARACGHQGHVASVQNGQRRLDRSHVVRSDGGRLKRQLGRGIEGGRRR